MSLTPCNFILPDRTLTYDEARQYLLDNPGVWKKSTAKESGPLSSVEATAKALQMTPDTHKTKIGGQVVEIQTESSRTNGKIEPLKIPFRNIKIWPTKDFEVGDRLLGQGGWIYEITKKTEGETKNGRKGVLYWVNPIITPSGNTTEPLFSPGIEKIEGQYFINQSLIPDESIAKPYHAAKKDGSNPELVKAVEELLGGKKSTIDSLIDQADRLIEENKRKRGGAGSALQSIVSPGAAYDALLSAYRAVLLAAKAAGQVLTRAQAMLQAKAQLKDKYSEKDLNEAIDALSKALNEPIKTKIVQAATEATTLEKAKEAIKKEAVKEGATKEEAEKLGEAVEQAQPKVKTRGWVKSLREAKGIPQAFKDAVTGDRTKYEVFPNDIAISEAKAIVSEIGPDNAIEMVKDDKLPSKLRITIGLEAMSAFNKEGRFEDSADLALYVSERATDWGQGIQALSLISRLSPEGAVIYAKKMMAEVNAKLEKRDEKKREKVQKAFKKANNETTETVIENLAPDLNKPAKIKTPKKFGEKNTLFTREQFEKDLKELYKSGFAYSGIPAPMVRIAAFYIEGGARSSAEFSKMIVQELGERVAPFAEKLYEAGLNLVKEMETERNKKEFARLMRSPIPTTPTERKSKLEKVRELATKLDAELGGQEYSGYVGEFEAMKQAEAQEKQAAKDAKEAQKAREKAERENARLEEKLTKLLEKKRERVVNLTDLPKVLKGEGKSLADIVKSHYTVQEEFATSLTDKLVQIAGLAPDEAKALADKVQREFDRIATAKKKEIIDKYFARGKRKDALKSLVELTNLGAFSDAEFNQKFAEAMGYPQITEANIKTIVGLAEDIQKSKDGILKDRKITKLLNYTVGLAPMDTWGLVNSLHMASILMGPKTQTKNLVDNIMTFTGATTIDALRLAYKTKSAKAVAQYYASMVVGFQRALADAENTLRTGESPIRDKAQVSAILARHKFKGLLYPFNAYKYVPRFMTAMDLLTFEPLRESLIWQEAVLNSSSMEEAYKKYGFDRAKLAEMEKEAEAEADEEGMTGTDRELYIKRRKFQLLDQTRDPNVLDQAQLYAQQGTYTQKPTGFLGYVAGLVGQFKAKIKPAQAVFKFENTIANVTNTLIDYSIWGGLRYARGGSVFFGDQSLSKADKERLAARAIIGSTVTMVVYLLSMSWNDDDDDDEPTMQITAGGYDNSVKNEGLKQRTGGWQEYSIRFGDGPWLSYKDTPLFLSMAPVGVLRDFEKYRKEELTDDMAERIGILLGASLSTAVASSGPAEVGYKWFDAILDKGDPTKWWMKLINEGIRYGESLVPIVGTGGYNQFAEIYKDVVNDPQFDTKAHWYGHFLRNLPLASTVLKPKINALGEEVPVEQNILFQSGEKSPSNKYWDVLSKNRVAIQPPAKNSVTFYKDKVAREMTDDEYYEFVKIRGYYIRGLMDKLNVYDMSKDKFEKVIKAINSKSTKVAKLEVSSGRTSDSPRLVEFDDVEDEE